jgi:prepilin-type N-terminal cleavage/methylation domain-containing protein/prepilin-type processing-associated H-X9-DG protein
MFRCRSLPTTSASLRSLRRRRRDGFTLVELMVVIGIILILISILVPVVSRARQQAKATTCLANLRSLGQAFIGYVNTNRHAPIYQDQGAGPTGTTVERLSWEGAIATIASNRNVRLCPEALEPSGDYYGNVSQAYGDPHRTVSSSVGTDNVSYGSYGFNGFLYYLDPNQPNPTWGGARYASLTPPAAPNTPAGAAQLAILNYFFFPDPLTPGGGVPDNSLMNRPTGVPVSFGDAGSVPVFGDCNALDAWPRNDAKPPKPTPANFPSQQNDPGPAAGSYNVNTGDRGGITHMLGRYYLDRHRKAVNIVFLDGHAAPLGLDDLWKLRWNKYADPTNP